MLFQRMFEKNRDKWYVINEERLKLYNKKTRRKIKLEVLIYYGGNPPKCACCGESRIEFLTIDHINNDGAKHRKETKMHTGYQFSLWLIRNNFPEGFQILCWNCNCSRTHWGYCPHERE